MDKNTRRLYGKDPADYGKPTKKSKTRRMLSANPSDNSRSPVRPEQEQPYVPSGSNQIYGDWKGYGTPAQRGLSKKKKRVNKA